MHERSGAFWTEKQRGKEGGGKGNNQATASATKPARTQTCDLTTSRINFFPAGIRSPMENGFTEPLRDQICDLLGLHMQHPGHGSALFSCIRCGC